LKIISEKELNYLLKLQTELKENNDQKLEAVIEVINN
jgi:hypothetical protein